MKQRNVYSVGQINTYIRNMFAQDFMMNHVAVRGEVSDCKYHSSGHIYFTLKDETGVLKAIMFRTQAARGLPFRMKEGDRVVVIGAIRIYERDGKYQLYAEEISREGAGLLYQKFMETKKELEEMGMFAEEYKQPIPRFVSRVGVVTAPTGAAVRDIQNISHRRNPYVQMILYPALVQGEGAAESVAKGIAMLDAYGVDVIIAGRGGGSIEDLWAFNEEETARAIFSCNTPVISAVGHETDTTIADYVADLRAPTPSAAAELAVADISALQGELYRQKSRLFEAVTRKVQDKRDELARREKILSLLGPQEKLQDQKMRLARAQEDLAEAMQQKLALSRQEMEYDRQRLQVLMREKYRDSRHRMQIYIEKLKGLSPLEKLGQGYSYTADVHGRKITQTGQVKKGDTICVYVLDGRLQAKVTDIQKDKQDAGEV